MKLKELLRAKQKTPSRAASVSSGGVGYFDPDVGSSSSDSKGDVNPGTVELVAVHDSPPPNSYYTYLVFKHGERMLLINECNEHWWYVKHIRSELVGYVPSTYVARLNSLRSERCYHENLTRESSLRVMKIQNAKLPIGSFLMRKCSADSEKLALDVKTGPSTYGHFTIDHINGKFRLTSLQRGKPMFNTISSFVEYYRENAIQGVMLTSAVVRPVPRMPSNRDIWELDRGQFQLDEDIIGNGNFGEVRKGKWGGNLDIAVKSLISSVDPTEFMNEAEIMKTLDHQNLVRLYGVCTISKPMLLVMEYLKNGSLKKFMKRDLTLSTIIDVASQIANGMDYISSNGHIHRDLAARNVLVGNIHEGSPEIKIADFGLARTLTDQDHYKSHPGGAMPMLWTAPECLIAKQFTTKSDVWSFGVVLYEIFSQESPCKVYPEANTMNFSQFGKFLLNPSNRLPRPNRCPQQFYDDLMVPCFALRPEDRPSFTEIKRSLRNFSHMMTESEDAQ